MRRQLSFKFEIKYISSHNILRIQNNDFTDILIVYLVLILWSCFCYEIYSLLSREILTSIVFFVDQDNPQPFCLLLNIYCGHLLMLKCNSVQSTHWLSSNPQFVLWSENHSTSTPTQCKEAHLTRMWHIDIWYSLAAIAKQYFLEYSDDPNGI